MKKLRYELLDLEAWHGFDAESAAPTFFARAAWGSAIAHVFPQFTPATMRCRLDDGSDVIVPLMREMGGRFRWKVYHGMPFGSYTAVLRRGTQVESGVAARVLEGLLTLGDSVYLNPWPLERPNLFRANIRIREETSVIDISGGAEAALSRVDSKSKRMAGQARRRGVRCAIEKGDGAVDLYYNMLQEASRDRWHLATPRLPKEFIQRVCIEGKEFVEIWVARFLDEPVGAGIALYGSQEVLLWTTVMRAGMENLKPHNILHADIIEHAARRGIHWYNLGSSAGLAGVLRFKKSLGASSLPYDIIGHESILYRANKALRGTLRNERTSPSVS